MEKLDAFDTFNDWRADFVKDSSSAVGTFHARERFKALWGHFSVTFMTHVNHSSHQRTWKFKTI